MIDSRQAGTEIVGEIKITRQMADEGVKALREVLGVHEDSRTTLTEYDYEAVALVYARMRALESR
jgi:hypothetical protein